jgi:hypothetical protein
MPYAYKVGRWTIQGTFGDGTEIWTTHVYTGATNRDVNPPTDAGMQAFADAWKTYFTSGGAGLHQSTHCTSIKYATIKTDGKTDVDSVKYLDYSPQLNGAVNFAVNPNQIAVVVTLMSDEVRGLASKGRMYLPAPGSEVSATSRKWGGAAGVAAGIKTFLDTVNGNFEIGDQVILASQGRKAPNVGAPVNRQVRHVKVGDVLDTQRRRRNALVEVYQRADLV